MPHALNGLRVVSFESRRSAEMAELIRNYGGEPIQAPSMREVPLTDQREALGFGETLLAGDWDVLILLTGVGTRMLIAACATRWPKDEVVKALGRLTLVCRGPKPIAALKEVGLAPALTVPEPNTWRDLLSELDRKLPVAGKRVAVQEYGARNEELLAGLRQRGARVTAVPVYGWALPEDMRPLSAAIDRLAAGEVEVRCSPAPTRRTTCSTWRPRWGAQTRFVTRSAAERWSCRSVPSRPRRSRGTASSPTYTPSTRRWDIC